MRKFIEIFLLVVMVLLSWFLYPIDKYVSISFVYLGWIIICYIISKYKLNINAAILIAALYGLNMMIFLTNKLDLFR